MTLLFIKLLLTWSQLFASGNGLETGRPFYYYSGERLVMAQAPSTWEIMADKGAVLSADGRFFFLEKNADKRQPIASITKLMTALVFLRHNPGWEEIYEITAADKVEGGRLNLFLGDKVKIKDLFYTSLVASDNGATLALVHASGLSTEDFVAQMNELAKGFGLRQTSFADPIGLSDNNLSTAKEVAHLAKIAFNNTDISAATINSHYRFFTVNGREKNIESTDYLLSDPGDDSLKVLGGKTGYTEKAGYCFVGRLQNKEGREAIVAVLNSAGKNDRFKDSKALANWVFTNYNRHD